MLFTLQFPFADLRPFLRDQPEMLPTLPLNPDDQESFKERIANEKTFVRSFGSFTCRHNAPKFKAPTSKKKKKSGNEPCFWKDFDNLWSDESFYTKNNKALMFPGLEKQSLAGNRLRAQTAIKRIFHFSPFKPGDLRWTPCMRIEIGISYMVEGEPLTKKELHEAIRDFLRLDSRIPEHTIPQTGNNTGIGKKRTRKKYSNVIPLCEQSQNLAPLIVRTMSPHKEKRIHPDMVKDGRPLLTIHLRPQEIAEFPEEIHWVSGKSISGARIGYLPAGRKADINTWIFVMPAKSAKRKKAAELQDSIRNHTIAIMRYWSELKAILLIKSYVEENKDFGFDIRQGSNLVTYLKQISDFLCQTKWHGADLSIIADTFKTYEEATNIDLGSTREHIKAFADSIAQKCNTPSDSRPYLFICYSHDDTEWKDKIEREISKLTAYNIEYFVDTKIEPGESWAKKIEQKIETASVAILLISDNFFQSEYIMQTELPHIKDSYERHKLGKILPVWIAGALPEHHWLAHLQFLTAQKGPLENADNSEFERVMTKLTAALAASPS